MLASGLSNREIAITLGVSRRTAEEHVRRVLRKLGLNSRNQILAWALQQARSALAAVSPAAGHAGHIPTPLRPVG